MLAEAIKSERRCFADTLSTVGPDAPTLIEGWTAHDVAAHVLSLDRFGGVFSFLGRRLVANGLRLNDRAGRFAERGFASTKRRGFPWAIEQLRRDPPRLLERQSVQVVGLFEVFVHHEDVRRCNEPLNNRAVAAPIAEVVPWLLHYHRRVLPEDVQLTVRTAEREWTVGVGRPATLQGSADDVVLWLAGRRTANAAEVSGEAADDLLRAPLRI